MPFTGASARLRPQLMHGAATMATKTGQGWRIAGWGMIAGFLLTPLVAMRFTHEVKWTVFDFVFAGIVLGGGGLAAEATIRFSQDRAYRIAAALALLAAILLVWINAAVGIIGNENNPLNLLYGGVLAVALAGALFARFSAPGMAQAMAIAAAMQALVAVVAVVAGRDAPPGPVGQVLLNGFFVGLWAASAALFARAAARMVERV
jgi:hypothetical protein